MEEGIPLRRSIRVASLTPSKYSSSSSGGPSSNVSTRRQSPSRIEPPLNNDQGETMPTTTIRQTRKHDQPSRKSTPQRKRSMSSNRQAMAPIYDNDVMDSRIRQTQTLDSLQINSNLLPSDSSTADILSKTPTRFSMPNYLKSLTPLLFGSSEDNPPQIQTHRANRAPLRRDPPTIAEEATVHVDRRRKVGSTFVEPKSGYLMKRRDSSIFLASPAKNSPFKLMFAIVRSICLLIFRIALFWYCSIKRVATSIRSNLVRLVQNIMRQAKELLNGIWKLLFEIRISNSPVAAGTRSKRPSRSASPTLSRKTVYAKRLFSGPLVSKLASNAVKSYLRWLILTICLFMIAFAIICKPDVQIRLRNYSHTQQLKLMKSAKVAKQTFHSFWQSATNSTTSPVQFIGKFRNLVANLPETVLSRADRFGKLDKDSLYKFRAELGAIDQKLALMESQQKLLSIESGAMREGIVAITGAVERFQSLYKNLIDQVVTVETKFDEYNGRWKEQQSTINSTTVGFEQAIIGIQQSVNQIKSSIQDTFVLKASLIEEVTNIVEELLPSKLLVQEPSSNSIKQNYLALDEKLKSYVEGIVTSLLDSHHVSKQPYTLSTNKLLATSSDGASNLNEQLTTESTTINDKHQQQQYRALERNDIVVLVREQLEAEFKIVSKHYQTILTKVNNSMETLKRDIDNLKDQLSAKENDDAILIDENKVREVVQESIEPLVNTMKQQHQILPDLALESSGARVIPSLTSPTFHRKVASQFSVHDDANINELTHRRKFTYKLIRKVLGFFSSTTGNGLKDAYRIEQGKPPQTALNSDSSVGNCWAFSGSTGILTISLAEARNLDSFSIEHVAPQLVLDRTSAPKRVQFWIFDQIDPMLVLSAKPRLIAEYEYSLDGPATQNFKLDSYNNSISGQPVRFVQLRILTNHGKADYTCVYRFQVYPRLD